MPPSNERCTSKFQNLISARGAYLRKYSSSVIIGGGKLLFAVHISKARSLRFLLWIGRCAFPAVPQMHPFPAVPQMVTPYQNKLYTGNNRVVYFTMAIMSVTHIYMTEITELWFNESVQYVIVFSKYSNMMLLLLLHKLCQAFWHKFQIWLLKVSFWSYLTSNSFSLWLFFVSKFPTLTKFLLRI